MSDNGVLIHSDEHRNVRTEVFDAEGYFTIVDTLASTGMLLTKERLSKEDPQSFDIVREIIDARR